MVASALQLPNALDFDFEATGEATTSIIFWSYSASHS